MSRISGGCSMLPDVRSLASSNLKGDDPMKRIVVTVALACVLSSSALAGEVPSVGYAPPPPDPTHMTSVASLGDVPTGGYTQDAATDITLIVVQCIISVLSI